MASTTDLPATASRDHPVRSTASTLAAQASAQALEAEQARRLDDALVDQMISCGLTNLYVPQELGGLDVDPLTATELIEELATADGSTGWVTMILNSSLIAAWLDPETRAQLHADDDFVLAGMFAPIGKAVADGDGYRVTGRWPFNSGSVHATWMLGGVLMADGDEVRTLENGLPDWRFAFFPRTDCEIHDTWRATGLRATSSHDVSVEDIFVPAELIPAPMFDPTQGSGPLAHFSFFAQLSTLMGAVPLGIARRAIDEAVEIATARGRGGRPAMIADTDVQNVLLGCEAALRAARAGYRASIENAWETALADRPVTVEQRVALRMATWHAGKVGVDVVDACFRLGGGSALYDDVPLQRCWRDMHAASHHIFFSDAQLRDVGGVWLGQQDDVFFA